MLPKPKNQKLLGVHADTKEKIEALGKELYYHGLIATISHDNIVKFLISSYEARKEK
jgi:hypothetical protein